MPKLPHTPDVEHLRATPPAIIEIGPDIPLFRIYKRGGEFPTLWNQFRHYGPLSRFDHHVLNDADEPCAQSRGVLYAASDLATTLAEFFQHRRRRINRSDQVLGSQPSDYRGPFHCLDLTDTFSVLVGASTKLFSGPFRHTQAWSRGFYEAYPDIQGLYYRSSLTNRITVVFYERTNTQQLFPATTGMHRPLDSPLMLRPLTIAAQEIGYRLT